MGRWARRQTIPHTGTVSTTTGGWATALLLSGTQKVKVLLVPSACETLVNERTNERKWAAGFYLRHSQSAMDPSFLHSPLDVRNFALLFLEIFYSIHCMLDGSTCQCGEPMEEDFFLESEKRGNPWAGPRLDRSFFRHHVWIHLKTSSCSTFRITWIDHRDMLLEIKWWN